MSILMRNNVRVIGAGSRVMVLAHGYGCDQNMWRELLPAFEQDYRIVLFDYVGHGQSDASQFDAERYASLQGYARDIVEICHALKVSGAIFVGHSVSAMIGMLAAQQDPKLFERFVFVGPSPRYINDGPYLGGFTREDIEGLLDFLDSNHLGWSSTMAPVIMGNADRPELSQELEASFCRTNPAIAKHFARVTFLSDNREDLPKINIPCLILQCSEDAIAPMAVGEYVHRQIPGSSFTVLKATGHCPHLSAPAETIAAIKAFILDSGR
jgi:sigma-B regulation protein RsbQ